MSWSDQNLFASSFSSWPSPAQHSGIVISSNCMITLILRIYLYFYFIIAKGLSHVWYKQAKPLQLQIMDLFHLVNPVPFRFHPIIPNMAMAQLL